LGTKRRIYQVAKEFDVSNDTLIQFLIKLNFDIRNHMSPVSGEMYEEIKKKYGQSGGADNSDYEFRRRLKQKKAQEAAKQVEAQRELEERLKAATQFMADRSSIRIKRDTAAPTAHESVEAYIETAKKTRITPSKTESEKLHDEEEGASKKTTSRSQDETSAAEPEQPADVAKTAEQRADKYKSAAEKAALKKDQISETISDDTDSKAKTGATPGRSRKSSEFIEEKSQVDEKADSERLKTAEKISGQKDRTKSTGQRSFDKKTGSDAEIKKRRPPFDRRNKPFQQTTPTRKSDKEPVAGVQAKGPQTSVAKEEGDAEPKKKRRRRRRKRKVEHDVEARAPFTEPETKEEVADESEFSIRDRKKRKKTVKKRREDEAEGRDRQKKKRKKKKPQISEAEVEKSIRQTFAIMEESARGRKKRKRLRDKDVLEGEEVLENLIRVNEFISVTELAEAIEIEPKDVIKKCLEMGLLVSINQRLDKDVIEMVADEFGFEVEILPEYGQDLLEELEEGEDEDGEVLSRPPVVTIMGHVDHGKTSLLDYIRESNIIAGEAGGITQHIGAYEVRVNGKAITFLDTPGHEAFTAMRARGVQTTDIVVLIVAADDAVMPQTIEAINHAQAASVPIIVAINKIDKANANIELIKKQLAENNVLIEEWGGKYQCAEISAKTGEGVAKLLEMILVESEMLELKANYDRLASGVILESRLDKGKGVVATVLVQKGTLNVGDAFIVGQYFGKVRSLFNERNQRVEEAAPSIPVQVVGFSGLPAAGDQFIVLRSERDTREISLRRQQIKREQEMRRTRHLSLDEISRRIKQGAVKELKIIVKADVDGSVEALSDALVKHSNAEVAVKVIHKGVGAISESDVLLASASEAVVLGFHVRPTLKAREIAKRENVEIRQYTVIYDAIAEVKKALEGLLEPETTEDVHGMVEVRQIFKIPKVGVIAGCHVISGRIARNDKAKLYRNDKLIYDGRITSLRRFKEDIKEVTAGFECGIGFDGFHDIHVNDIIEPYHVSQTKRTLTSV